MILPSLDECTIAIRCCPVYFELRKNGPTSTMALPYRIIFAVATQHSILIYDTQQISPIAVISNIHYTRLTDIAWFVEDFFFFMARSSHKRYKHIQSFFIGLAMVVS